MNTNFGTLRDLIKAMDFLEKNGFSLDDESEVEPDLYEKALEGLAALEDNTEMSHEEMETEVKKRRDLLGLGDTLYTAEGMIARSPSENELKEVESFENRSGAKVYHIIESLYGDKLCLLFIPRTKGDLQAQINTMHNCGDMWQYAYVINRENPAWSETGPIKLMRLPTGVVTKDYDSRAMTDNLSNICSQSDSNVMEESSMDANTQVINFVVGERSPIIRPSGQELHVSESGFLVMTFFSKPTSKEIRAFQADGNISIRAGSIGNTMYWVTKVGNTECDCTYCPHIVTAPPELEEITDDSLGYAAHFVLIDSATGIVKANRLVGLPNSFSKKVKHIYDEVCANMSMSYDESISRIFSYSTRKLAQMASVYCKIGAATE